MTEAAKTAFWNQLNKLRERPERPNSGQLARLALESGLSPQETLREIEKVESFGRFAESERFEAIITFLAELCSDLVCERTIEYTCRPRLLSAGAFEKVGSAAGRIICPSVGTSELFTTLFPNSNVIRSVDDIDPSSNIECVICQSPIGYRPKVNNADGFGGEAVVALAKQVSGQGRIFWLTARAALHSVPAQRTLSALAAEGWGVVAQLDIPAGAFAETSIEGALIILERREVSKRMVGALRDKASAVALAAAFRQGLTKKLGPTWVWLDRDDPRTYSKIESERLLHRLTPRGRHQAISLGELVIDDGIAKADKEICADSHATGYLFVPEYALSRVTTKLEEQTVKPRAVFRVPIDTSKANPHFLATLLNSPYGRELRASAATGTTIQRISSRSLMELSLPLPELTTQDQLARVEADLSLLEASFDEMRNSLQGDWQALSMINERLDSLKSVLDIEKQIENWWAELPYPLATIYRRYQISIDPKERLDWILHFFELAAVYLAAIGTSHVKALRPDWQEHFSKWFHPAGVAGIERADFGFWIMLAGASLKDLSRIASTPELRQLASQSAGPELVEIAGSLGTLGKTTEILDTVRRYRNSWKGHGGHVKDSDAARLDLELQPSIREFYEATSAVFRRFLLVRPGLAEVTDEGYAYQIELLVGSDPAFEAAQIDLQLAVKSNVLAFWMNGAGTMCRALPFFRLGAPLEPKETSFYVFNRVEEAGFRWISYHEAREQEFVAPDAELTSLIALPGRDAS